MKSLRPTKKTRKLPRDCVDMGENPFKVERKYKLPCKYKEMRELLEFYVVSTQAPPVQGMSSYVSLKSLKLILSVDEIRKPEQTQSDVA